MPYLVMDYVDGVPIDRYCDNHTLSIDQRLQLFRTACSAVEYAHAKQIIHRDLKPANILITKEGVPRLLDFGIAKLLDPALFQTNLVTQANWRPMTPEYASPEQVRGQEVTKSSDIYSLGVMLYELLTDHRPYRATGQSRLEIERSVCEEEAEKPSTAIGRIEVRVVYETPDTTEITPELVARNRGLESGELRRRLQGDLDTILMKALRKKPEDRYASVQEFSDDIERHLSGRPVVARRPSLSYRGSRLLKRHKESVATALILLVLASAFGLWEARNMRLRDADKKAASVPAGSRRSVAVLGFKNLSARPDTAWISTALSETLTTDLGAGDQLRTIPGETVARMKTDLGISDMDNLAPESLERVRRGLNADYVVLDPISTWVRIPEAKSISICACRMRRKEKRSPPFPKRAVRNNCWIWFRGAEDNCGTNWAWRMFPYCNRPEYELRYLRVRTPCAFIRKDWRSFETLTPSAPKIRSSTP